MACVYKYAYDDVDRLSQSGNRGLRLCTRHYYDPINARWLTRDPAGYDGGINLYGYCDGNPVMRFDPYGLDWLTWTRDLAEWAQFGSGAIKDSIFGGCSGWGLTGICISTASGSAIDFVSGALQFPNAIDKLGTGAGGYDFRKGFGGLLDVDAIGLWEDEGTFSSVVLAGIAATPSGAKMIRPANTRKRGYPSTPVGRLGKPIQVIPGTNEPATIGRRVYTGHALDRMQERGLTPSVIEDTIKHGALDGLPKKGAQKLSTGQASVVVDTKTGRVVTVIPRSPKP